MRETGFKPLLSNVACAAYIVAKEVAHAQGALKEAATRLEDGGAAGRSCPTSI
jgi:hypothetical protein